MLQPPPRKVKPTALLKDVQTEQAARLQEREQQLLDILEDIRQFSKQRSDLERHYGQTLLKLTNQMLSKKELFHLPDIRTESGPQKRTVNSAWKKVLEETEKLAWQRIKAAEIYTGQVTEPSRLLKENMVSVVKKAMENLSILHKDMAQTAADMAAAQKVFADDESAAMASRLKAADAEMRFKKRQTSLLTSQGTLQKNTAKSLARREVCNAKAIHSRNMYLLELAAANAHTARLHDVDLPNLYTLLDEGVYEELSTFLQVLGKTEVDVCSAILHGYKGIAEMASLVDREYNLQCFITNNEVFDIPIHFEYESVVGGNSVQKLSLEYQEEQYLYREARKWAAKKTSEMRHIHELNKAISKAAPVSMAESRSLGRSVLSVNSIGKDVKRASSNTEDSDATVSLESLYCSSQRAEVGKAKAEARLELLKAAGINVDAALEHAVQSSTSRAVTVDNSGDYAAADQDAVSHHSINGDNWSLADDDDDSFDSFSESESSPQGSLAVSSDPPIRYPYNVTALYAYEASNADELSLSKGEILEIVHPGDGDGWLKARNAQGHTGLVPGNYLETLCDSDEPQSPGGGTEALVSSAGADNTSLTSGVGSSRPADGISLRSVSLYSASDYEVQQALMPKDSGVKADGVWLRALYDYSASCSEELSFCEGQFIHLISKIGGGVDDGYWQGQVGEKVGVFPSLVVEELSHAQYPTIEQARLLQSMANTNSASATSQCTAVPHPSTTKTSAVGLVAEQRVVRRPAVLEVNKSLHHGSSVEHASPGGNTVDSSPTRPTPKQRSSSQFSDRRSQVEAQLAAAASISQKAMSNTSSDNKAADPVHDMSDCMKPAIAPRPMLLGHSAAVYDSFAPQPASSQAVLASILQKGLSSDEGRAAAGRRGAESATRTDSGRVQAAAGVGLFARSNSTPSHVVSQDDSAIRLRSRTDGTKVGSSARPLSMAASAATGIDKNASVHHQMKTSESRRPRLEHQSATTDSLYNPSYRHAVNLSVHQPASRHACGASPTSPTSQDRALVNGREQARSAASEGVPRRQQFSTPQPIRRSRQPSTLSRKESAV